MSEVVHYSESGCPLAETLPRDPIPFFSNGDLNFKAHDVGWLVAGFFSVVATWASMWLILKHLSFFYHPSEQRMIVRILFMPIVYAWCSFFSYYFVKQAIYWQLARDCYEAIVIGSFFYLLLSYLSNPRPTREEPFPQPYKTQAAREAQLRASIKNVRVKKWMWPLGFIKWRPGKGKGGEGEAFVYLMRVLVGQYVIVRPLSTLASVVAQSMDYYCLASWSPKFVHVWSSAAITISVTVAMYAVLQLYVELRTELAPYRPLLKACAIKLVVFFTFWQESSLSLLVTIGVIKNRTYWSAEDIVVGCAGLLSCAEMAIFAFMHIKAFSYLPYRALAAPISLDDDVLSIDELRPTPTRELTFAEWCEWDKGVKEREKERARLAKPKLPKQVGDLPVAKREGSPFLRQTKKWPAFVKCIRITDLVRELGDETRWVARGGKVEMTEELLEEDRKENHEEIVGLARPSSEKGRGKGDVRNGGDLDAELRRLRESRPVSSKGTTIDANGNRVLKKGTKHAWSREQDRLLEGEEQGEDPSRSRDGTRRVEREGWWTAMIGSLGRSQSRQSPSFEQRIRLEPTVLAVEPRTSSSFRRPRLPPLVSHTPDSIPVMSSNSQIPLPPPHRLDSGPRGLHRPDTALAPRLSDLHAPQRTIKVDIDHPRNPSRESDPSQDSFGHLPSTTLRPPSFVPPAQLVSRSPPPFAHLHVPTSSPDHPPALEDSSPAEHHTTPPSLVPPPAAFFAPGTASSMSRGLPIGAAPPTRHA